jgi:hypothetical protein
VPTIPTELTVGLIINLMAVILSLVSTYFPGFREIYAAWDSAHKALFQLYIVTGIVLVAALLTFTKVLVLVTPDVNGVLLLIVMWGTALYSNQTTYGYSQPPQSVLDAKAGRIQN